MTTVAELRREAREEFEKGRWRESEELYYGALEKIEEKQSSINEGDVCAVMELGELLYFKERKNDCLKISKQAVQMAREYLPDNKNCVIKTILNLIDALSFFDNRDDTEAAIKSARDLAMSRENPRDELLAEVLCTESAAALFHEDTFKFAEAESLLDEAAEILKDRQVESGKVLSSVLAGKAICAQLAGEISTSEEFYKKAMRAVDDDPLSPYFSDSCFGFATLRATDSKFAESIEFLESRIKERESAVGTDHPILKRAVAALALTYTACGELDLAEVEAQRYNRIVEMMGNPGAELRIDCLRILVDVLQQQSRFSEAQALLARANDLAESLEEESVQVRLLMDLARLKLDLGDFADSVTMYEKALEIVQRLKGDQHFETAMCLGLLGNAYFAVRDYDRAESSIRQSIKLASNQEEFFGSLLGADNYRYLGLVCMQKKKYDEAEEAFLKALSVLASTNMEGTLHAAETQKNLGELYDAMGKTGEARTHFANALEMARHILGDENFEVADYQCCLADALRADGELEDASQLYKEALSVLERTLGPGHPRTCTLLQRFGEMAIENNNYDEAERYFESALSRLEQTLGTTHPDVGYTCYCLGATYHWKERLEKAENYYRRALSIKEHQLGKNHKDLATIMEPLIDILTHQGRQAEASALQRRINEITSYDSQK